MRFVPFPELQTLNLELKQLNMDDLNDFHVLRSDERVMRYIPRRRSVTLDDTRMVIQNTLDLLPEGNHISWAIKFKGNPKLIGTIGFYRIQWEHFRGEVGYILHPDYHGKGIMSEALKEILHFGFHSLHFHTIEAVIDPGNKPSENILVRHGFVKEAYFKENCFFEGKFYDSAVYTKFK